MLFGDYHTHTRFSHGKGTVMGNCQRAFELGLKEIAITDHSFGHLGHPIRKRRMQAFLQQIRAARLAFIDLRVIAGLECNLLDGKGTIDFDEGLFEAMDKESVALGAVEHGFIVLGYHKFIKPTGVKEFFGFNLPMFFGGARVGASRKAKTTDAFIKAFERFPVSILSHPCVGVGVDMKALSEAAAHFGVYLEINGRRIAYSREDIDIILASGAQFIINSDAHKSENVGVVDKPLAFIKEMGIDLARVANWGKSPEFRGGR